MSIPYDFAHWPIKLELKKKKKGLAALLGYHLHTTKFPIGSTQLSEF